MRARAAAAVLAAAALVAAGCGAAPEAADRDAAPEPADPAATPAPPRVSPDGPVTVPLEDTAGLGLRGEVTLASAGPQRTDVAVELAGPDDVAFSASIREGTCAAPGALVHDLGVVETGAGSLSATAPLQGLLSQQRAFVLSADEGSVVACADLPRRTG